MIFRYPETPVLINKDILVLLVRVSVNFSDFYIRAHGLYKQLKTTQRIEAEIVDNLSQLYNLKITKHTFIHRKTHQCTYFVEARDTGSTGIDMQRIDCPVVHHLEDMGMSTDEERRWPHEERTAYGRVIISRISTDMLDEHISSLDGETVGLWITQTNVPTINISMYCTKGAESLKPLSHLKRAYVSGMPYFIALGKVPRITFVPIAMGIRE